MRKGVLDDGDLSGALQSHASTQIKRKLAIRHPAAVDNQCAPQVKQVFCDFG